jgi:hypothetical protein
MSLVEEWPRDRIEGSSKTFSVLWDRPAAQGCSMSAERLAPLYPTAASVSKTTCSLVASVLQITDFESAPARLPQPRVLVALVQG